MTKINITKEEFQTLLETLYISEWVMNAFSDNEKEEDKNFKSLKQKLLTLHEEAQAEDLLNRFSTVDFDEYMHENYLEQYNNNVFWESLIDQLAIRDLTRKIGQEAFEKMEAMERLEALEEYRDHYGDEFSQNQLENVKVGKA